MLEFLVSSRAVPVWLVILLAFLAVLLAVVIWSIRSHRDPILAIRCDAPLDDLMPSLSGLTQGTLYEGNAVELFENGALFEALFAEIAAATRTIHFETFLWKDGELGSRLVNALIERRRAGVQVRVMVDADGGKKMGNGARQRLTDAGCALQFHHPKTWRNIGVVNDRDHRKLAVFDGRTAIVCGHCIVDSWLGNAEDADHVRDLGIRVRGPIVHAVQAVFSENWVENSGELIVGDAAFPELQRAGDVAIHVASIKPEGSPPAVKILHHLVVCVARKRIRIQNPYFLPDDEAIDALAKAVARGVDVRIMVPSADASDMPMVQHAAHRNFHKLLRADVRIFEFGKCLLHQKVMSVDGVWCAIGSSNFDDRSFETNDEITLGLRDPGLALKFEDIFDRDLEHCVELHLDTWQHRGLLHRARDNACHVFNELL